LVNIWAKRVDSGRKGELEDKLKSSQIKLGKWQAKKKQYWDLFNNDKIDKEELLSRTGI